MVIEDYKKRENERKVKKIESLNVFLFFYRIYS